MKFHGEFITPEFMFPEKLGDCEMALYIVIPFELKTFSIYKIKKGFSGDARKISNYSENALIIIKFTFALNYK